MIFETLESLAQCLCAQIRADGSPDTCFCGVVPGAQIALDYAGDCDFACGMAWVRLANGYPASGVGEPNVTIRNCSAGLGIDIEVGIVRCFPVSEDGEPPAPSELLEIARQQNKDMLSGLRAISCCEAIEDYIVSQWAPIGPEGGLIGGAWGASVAL